LLQEQVDSNMQLSQSLMVSIKAHSIDELIQPPAGFNPFNDR
jgi:hypothetical protein